MACSRRREGGKEGDAVTTLSEARAGWENFLRRRELLVVMVAAFVHVSLAALAVGGPRPAAEKPNIVMLFIDDLGYGDVGFTGHPTTATPNIDKLAWNGKILTTWYSGCSVCSCSRASLMTGRTWRRYGVPGVFSPTTNSGLPLNETTVATLLKGAGYATGIVGKWHLGQRRPYLPAARGFDSYLGVPYSVDMGQARATSCSASGMRRAPGEHAAPPAAAHGGAHGEEEEDPWGESRDERRGGALWDALHPYMASGLAPRLKPSERDDPGGKVLPLVSQTRAADGTVNTTVLEQPLDFTKLAGHYERYIEDFVASNAEQPFFLYVPHSHVHTTADNQPDRQYAGCAHQNSTKRGSFGDALAEADSIVGSLVASLAAHNLSENTLIMFTGDNGPWMYEAKSGGSTGLFSGRFSGYWNVGKGSTWEGGIREAGFAHWPGTIAPSSRSSEIVSSMDVLPTALELAGVPLPTDRAYDGKSMVPIILADGPGSSSHDYLFFYVQANSVTPTSARHGPFKAHWRTAPGLGECVVGPEAPAGCPVVTYTIPLIFNVDVDPSEAYPLVRNDTMPTDPALVKLVQGFQAAYAKEVSTLHPTSAPPEPDGPGEGPGRYGVCCDEAKQCDCDGKPSSGGKWPAGIGPEGGPGGEPPP